ncbi:hypothetical protein ACFSUP_04270 [Gracilibacillus thailandensis]|uniref:hypothetical protein n=1 Tax=Gracilibacillus thailandensis TaxID=563735 RepID=UPI00363832FF
MAEEMTTIPIEDLECQEDGCEEQPTHVWRLDDLPAFYCREHAAIFSSDQVSALPGHDELGPDGVVARMRYDAMRVNDRISTWWIYVLIGVALASNWYPILHWPASVGFGIVLFSLMGSLCKSAERIDQYGNTSR